MDIDGLGEKQAMRFLEEGLIADVADIYELSEEQLVELEGFGEISARNLLAAIDASRARPFKRVLYALGLPGVGYVTAEALADHFGSIDAMRAADPEGSRRSRGSARSWPSRSPSRSPTRAPGAGREAAGEGAAAGGGPSERRATGGPLKARPSSSPAPCPSSPARRRRRGQERGRQGGQFGLEKRPTSWWRERAPAQARRGSGPGRRGARRSGPRASFSSRRRRGDPACSRWASSMLPTPPSGREDHRPAVAVEAVAGEVDAPVSVPVLAGSGQGGGPAMREALVPSLPAKERSSMNPSRPRLRTPTAASPRFRRAWPVRLGRSRRPGGCRAQARA